MQDDTDSDLLSAVMNNDEGTLQKELEKVRPYRVITPAPGKLLRRLRAVRLGLNSQNIEHYVCVELGRRQQLLFRSSHLLMQVCICTQVDSMNG